MSDLLFHFTRQRKTGENIKSANLVLDDILNEGKLRGTNQEGINDKVVCFTEAPIQEFNSIFSLASIGQTPRYEPYGVAVPKKWLYEQGGRHVIYDDPNAKSSFSEAQLYRFVPYDPLNGNDNTWEREWRIKKDELILDPKHTLVIVPSSTEAFEIVYGRANISIEEDWEADGFGEGYQTGSSEFHTPYWLAVSLDIFGFKTESNIKNLQ
ncbi:hypothetical protein [Methylobacter tundripaludum]|nr:hypothetical protein [Methylobacter tundripaludum]